MTPTTEHDEAELERLLEEVFRTYHHDFRHYVRSTIRRRVDQALTALALPSIASMIDGVLADPRMFGRLLRHLTIPVSDMFRDPSYWLALREHVVPHLATQPFPRVWIAGCAAGEEAYSMAILLAEEGLLERAQIYATDIAAASLEAAAAGSYELGRVRSFSANYLAAGGKASLSDYYVTTATRAGFAAALRAPILFSDHSLATDAAFAEVHLVCCRNVLIYFDRTLQDRAVAVFADALGPRGFLGLGSHETLGFSTHAGRFEPFVAREKIYRLRGAAA